MLKLQCLSNHYSSISHRWISKSFFFKSQFFRSAGNVIQQIKKVWPNWDKKYAVNSVRIKWSSELRVHFNMGCQWSVSREIVRKKQTVRIISTQINLSCILWLTCRLMNVENTILYFINCRAHCHRLNGKLRLYIYTAPFRSNHLNPPLTHSKHHVNSTVWSHVKQDWGELHGNVIKLQFNYIKI